MRNLIFICLMFLSGCTGNNRNYLFDSTVALVHDHLVYCGGVWISQDQFITAQHCIEDKIVFRMYGNGEEYFGSKIRDSVDSDLSLVMSVGVPNHSFVKIGKVDVGESVEIIGHTGGLEYTYMRGETSSYRDYKGEIYLQVSSLAFFGNSGGGVFHNGELVGISSVIYGRSPGVMFFSSSFAIEKFLNGLN